MFRPLLAGCFVLVAPSIASAATAVAPASVGQPALAVGFSADGKLYAKSCAALPCAIDGGERIDVPATASSHIDDAKLAVVGIGEGKRAIVVTLPARDSHPSWQAVVVARPGEPRPAVVFSGLTGYVEGVEGERHGGMVVISEPQPDGGRRIVVGEQREDVSLCGRPAVVMPELLDAHDLKLHRAKIQRLSVEDRAGAKDAVAERVEPRPAQPGEPKSPTPNLLRAVVATSAIGSPAALTDGNPETTWAEQSRGDGRGEFVLLNAPPKVPLSSIELVIRPPTGGSPKAVAPRELYLVARSSVVHVTFPEDGWRTPGARYRVALDPPITSDCLAVVVQSAFHDSPDAEVTLAEVSAGSALESASIDQLMSALAAGGAQAEAASALLAQRGEPAFAAIDAAFDRLSVDGRRSALDAVDQAPCAQGVPVYVHALLGRDTGLIERAGRRLSRCSAEAGPALTKAFGETKGVRRGRLAAVLADIDPAAAVSAIVPLLDNPSPVERGRLRVALARAARTKTGAVVVRQRLGDASVPEIAALDLLRSLGNDIGRFAPEANEAFKRLARPEAGSRTRFLVLEVAAGLAGDPSVRSYLESAMSKDPDAHIRTQAVRAASKPAAYGKPLLSALDDRDMRVRQAALEALANPESRFATDAIARRLSLDPWPSVRAQAARSLGELGTDPRIDAALAQALDDASPVVVVPALLALGARHAVQHAEPIRGRLDDQNTPVLVRAAAASALGLMCHRESTDVLTEYAQKLKDPMLDADHRVIGAAALGALGRLKPPDLAQRLAPLRTKSAPHAVRDAADSALKEPGACSAKPRS